MGLLQGEEDQGAPLHRVASPSPVEGLPGSRRSGPGVGGIEKKGPVGALSVGGKDEGNGLVVGVEEDQEGLPHKGAPQVVPFVDQVSGEANAEGADEVGVPFLVGHLVADGREPRNVLDLGAPNLAAVKELASPEGWLAAPQGHQIPGEVQEILLVAAQVPVVPGGVVVLAIGIVVAPLAPGDLVASADHGDPLGDQEGGKEVAHLPEPELPDLRLVRGTLLSAVPADVVVVPVPVLLEVGLVVLFVVAHQVVEGEAVVGGDEIDAGVGSPPFLFVEVAAAGEPGGQFCHLSAIALPEAPDGIPVESVPLRPEGGEVPHLVPSFAHIPGLGDELDLGDDRILLDDVEEGRELVHLVELPGQSAGQVETKAVHMHLQDPVSEAVHDELENLGVAHVQGVAASGVVHVMPGILVHQPVVGGVVDALEGEGGAQVVPLAGVVVDHVEDDLDAGVVEAPDHHFEFVGRGHGPRAVPVVRGEVGEGVVSPVIGEIFGDQRVFAGVVVDGKELDGGDSQGAEVVDHRFAGQPCIGSPDLGGELRVESGKALHMGLVDDGFGPGRSGGTVGSPDVGGVHDDRQGGPRGIVPVVRDHVSLGISQGIGKEGVIPADSPGDLLGVGIEKDLGGVEPESPGRVVGAVDPVAVDPPRPGFRKVDVPDMVGPLGEGNPHRLGRGLPVGKKAEFDALGIFGKEGKVDPFSVPGGAQGEGFSGQGSHESPLFW